MNLLDKLRKRLSMTGREFWIKARGLQEGHEVDISTGDNRWIETLVQQVSPHPENSGAVKMGPFLHVTEKTDRAEIDAILNCIEALENHVDYMRDTQGLRNTAGERALAELSRALDKTEAG